MLVLEKRLRGWQGCEGAVHGAVRPGAGSVLPAQRGVRCPACEPELCMMRQARSRMRTASSESSTGSRLPSACRSSRSARLICATTSQSAKTILRCCMSSPWLAMSAQEYAAFQLWLWRSTCCCTATQQQVRSGIPGHPAGLAAPSEARLEHLQRPAPAPASKPRSAGEWPEPGKLRAQPGWASFSATPGPAHESTHQRLCSVVTAYTSQAL